jgi:alpha-L-rhamnosidase
MNRRSLKSIFARNPVFTDWKRVIVVGLIFSLGLELSALADILPAVTTNALSGAPSTEFSVTQFGAIGDGQTLNTRAIQQGIDTLAAQGGGTLNITPGTFLTGSIFLKPGVNLHLEAGAVLKGSTELKDYPEVITRIEGLQQPLVAALINASHCPDLRITGSGTIDGSGKPFWVAFWQAITRNPKTTNIEVKRPRLMFLEHSSGVHLEGLKLINAGFWNIHVYDCNQLVIDGLDITAPNQGLRNGPEIAGKNWQDLGPVRAPSSDGIDVDSCQHVIIRNCSIGVDDDNIALKGSKGPFALDDKASSPVNDVLVENCIFRYGHGALTFGSEATVIQNVIMRHCQVLGGHTVLRLKLRPDTTQTYEHILIEDLTVNPSGRLISASPWNQYADLQGQPQSHSQIRDVTIRHVRGQAKEFGSLINNATSSIKGVRLEDIDVQSDLCAFKVDNHVSGLKFEHVLVNGKPPGIDTSKN